MDTSELLSCPYCGRGILNKRLYSIAETGHVLGVPASTIRFWIKRGLLASRFWPRSRASFWRRVDSKDIEAFIEDYFPRSDQIRPDSPNPRARRIWEMVEWHRRNGRAGKAKQLANRAVREKQNGYSGRGGT